MNRFNFMAHCFDDVKAYYFKRALQLLRFNIKLVSISGIKQGVIAKFLYYSKEYYSLYLYPSFRGSNLFSTILDNNTPIITSNDCNIEQYLLKNGYQYVVMDLTSSSAYNLISSFYTNQVAKRTGVELMNHIDEGIAILNWINSNNAANAYCLHPIVQSDSDLVNSLNWIKYQDPIDILYTTEYRSVANEYLSNRIISDISDIRLSPLDIVNKMLIADKIQNRKDFELYHKSTHTRSKELTIYFDNWLRRLNISEDTYNDIKDKLIINPVVTNI